MNVFPKKKDECQFIFIYNATINPPNLFDNKIDQD